MKRKLAFLLIVATMLFTLAGCGGGTAANESAATENSAASESESAASAEATTISVGVPTAPPKQISWRRVRLKAIFVLILERSLGTFT